MFLFTGSGVPNFEGETGKPEEKGPRNLGILESLNIFPKSTHFSPDSKLPDSLSTNRTSSPSAGIRSEMEYVVQKIAALANTHTPTPNSIISTNENSLRLDSPPTSS